MTVKLRQALQYVIDHVNDLSDDEYARFMDDLVCNMEVDLSNREDEDRDF